MRGLSSMMVAGLLGLLVTACTPPQSVQAVPAPRVAPPEEASAESIVFLPYVPRVGEVTEEIEERRLTMRFEDGTRVEQVERVEERHTVLTVLALRDGVPIRARVSYQRHRHQPEKTGASLEGQSFLLERTADGLSVTRDTDGALEETVRRFVAKDFARFGKRGVMQGLPRTPISIGASAGSIEEKMRRELASRAPGELSGLSVHLSEIRDGEDGKVAVFVARFTSVDKKRDVTMRLEAEFHIRARDSAMLSSVVTGPMEMGGEVHGTGTVRMVSEYSYR